MNFFGNPFKWTPIGIDSDAEMIRVLSGVVIDKQAVAGAEINNYPARKG